MATKLSEKPKTAGTSTVHFTEPVDENDNDVPEVNYTLGQKYQGGARRQVKTFGSRQKSGRKPLQERSSNSGRGYRRGRRLYPSWMRGVKGCFVCGLDHRANTRHPKEEVMEAIKRLKQQHPIALLTVADMEAVYLMIRSDDEESDDQQAEVRWAGEEGEQTDDAEYAYTTEADWDITEESLANSAFIHGTSYDPSAMLTTMRDRLSRHTSRKFEGIRFDTACNRRSVISLSQYRSYCKDFGIGQAIRSEKGRGVVGLGGFQSGIGRVRIQIPFPALRLVIDVDFLVVRQDIPALLSVKDMIDNGIDISIENKCAYHNGLTQPLSLVN